MSNYLRRDDPFAKVERYRGGVLMPVALFLVGAAATVWAAKTLAILKQQDVKIQTMQAAAQFVEQLNAMPPDQREAFLRSLPRTETARTETARTDKTKADKLGNPIPKPVDKVPSNVVEPDATESDATPPTNNQLKRTE